MPNRSLLIFSLDAVPWKAVDPWLKKGHMPTLSGLIRSGSAGDLRGLLPTLPPPNWASFWTGRNPGCHTLLGYLFAFREHGNKRPPLDTGFLEHPTWPEMLSGQGLRTLFHHWRAEERLGNLSDLAQRVRERFPPLWLPHAETFFKGPEGSGGIIENGGSQLPAGFRSLDDIREFSRRHIHSVTQTKATARQLLQKSSWDVAMVHFLSTDPFLHALWHGVDPRHPKFDPAIHQEVGTFFSALDQAMGELIEFTRPSAVIVFSQYGMMTCHKILNVSRVLFEAGMVKHLPFEDRIFRRAPLLCRNSLLGKILGRVSRKIQQRVDGLSWLPPRVFLETKVVYMENLGKNCKDANQLIRILEDVQDPETGCRIVQKAWLIEELYGIPKFPGWDIVVLENADGYTVRGGDVNLPMFWPCRPNQHYMIGTHHQTGLWVFSGKGIANTKGILANILALPPTILHYFDVAIPEWMEGNVLPIFVSNQGIKKAFNR